METMKSNRSERSGEMSRDFYTMGGHGGEMARQVDEYRLEGRLRNARRGSVGRAFAVLGRVLQPDGLSGGGEMKPREA
jgi:hypothetical protein